MLDRKSCVQYCIHINTSLDLFPPSTLTLHVHFNTYMQMADLIITASLEYPVKRVALVREGANAIQEVQI